MIVKRETTERDSSQRDSSQHESSQQDSSGGVDLVTVAVRPGPVTGMTVATGAVIDALAELGDVRSFALENGYQKPGRIWAFRKSINAIAGALWLLLGKGRVGHTVYLCPNAGWGLWQTLLHTLVAKWTRRRVVLHHHVCSYSNDHSRLMACVQNRLDDGDVNLMLAEEMSTGMRRYQSRAQAFELPYGYLVDAPEYNRKLAPISKERPLVLGHLSNLTFEKGLAEVLQLTGQLVAADVPVRLCLAGPAHHAAEREAIAAAQRELGDAMQYLGPVYGTEKTKFFEAIDVFLMPTRYKNEAQPIVIVEALGCGIPVLATRQGCIASLVGRRGGHTVESADDFVDFAMGWIRKWVESPPDFRDACRQAGQRGETFIEFSKTQLRTVVAGALRPPSQADDKNSSEGFEQTAPRG
ncbi:MAG: glycosyltransferase family 4 protein [Planctomycetota bacterium]